MLIDFLIILGLVVLNGFFVMSEIAVVSAKKARLEVAANRGNKTAKLVERLTDNPVKFLSTTQIGITIIGLLTGIYSGDSITNKIELLLSGYVWIKPYSSSISIFIVVIPITYLTIVVGELLPKKLGLTSPEGISIVIIRPMLFLAKICMPFIWLLERSTNLLFDLMHIKPSTSSQVTEEEIKALVEEGMNIGAIDEIEQDLVENVFQLGDRKIGSLMTHQRDIVWLDANKDFEWNKQLIEDRIYSIYPLCDGSLEKVLGFVYIKDLLQSTLLGKEIDLQSILKPMQYFPENTSAYKVLETFKQTRVHCGLIVDEFGVVIGIVSLNDILDALVGDINDSEEEEHIIERENGGWLVDAQLPFADFCKYFDIFLQADQYSGFHTISGLVLDVMKKIPKTGERFEWKNLQFEIIDMDNNRIDKILVDRIQEKK